MLTVVGRRHHREDAVVVEAANGIPLGRLAAAGVEEHQDGAAPRRVIGERRHRREHRVLVVLTSRDDPHVDPLAGHQPGQQRVEPLLDPRRDQLVLLAVRQHAHGGIGIGRLESDGFSRRWHVPESDGFSRRWHVLESDGFSRRYRHCNSRDENSSPHGYTILQPVRPMHCCSAWRAIPTDSSPTNTVGFTAIS